ncbi:hypothetical protein URH17368_1138 [Alicyclobacillus hesperidum URH17-3-68]|nr:hypothetical protein URH17368_1138 [Alicyclobacillus hesperidum URH17-3-68]
MRTIPAKSAQSTALSMLTQKLLARQNSDQSFMPQAHASLLERN